MKNRILPRLLGAALLATALAAASPAAAESSFFNALVEPGERLQLAVGVLDDGTGGTMRNIIDENGDLVRLEIPGKVRLRSPRLNLDCEYLLYEPERELLEAKGNVVIIREDVTAKGQHLLYNIETGEAVLTGAPEVEQRSPENNTNFHGMENLDISPGEDGRMRVTMTGGEAIHGTVLPGTGTPEGGTATSTGSGMSGLGDNLNITTRRKGTADPLVLLSMGAEGAFELFRAEGAVYLESDRLNMRSDELEFSGPEQRIEALYNVFIRQDGVTADCGRMVYDLVKDEITLSVDPEIREERSAGTVARIFDIASYVIQRNPDGSTSTQSFPDPNKESQMVFESAEQEAGAENETSGSDEPREIRIESLDQNGAQAP